MTGQTIIADGRVTIAWQLRAPGTERPRCRSFRGLTSHRDSMANLLRILLAILLPPVGVFFTVGLGGQFWLNILLTILGYIPGIVHAIWIIARRTR